MADDEDKDFLLNGIISGFQLLPEDSQLFLAETDNYRSEVNPEARDKVEQIILQEIEEGNYRISPSKPTIISALAAIPKPDSAELHLIHDCSMPPGKVVNDCIDIDKFKFQTIDDAMQLIDKGYYLAKIDLRYAYRSISIHPSNYMATGLKWQFRGDKAVTYLIDTNLPYGGKSAPGIFNHITQSVCRMMIRRRFTGVVDYLDDFLIVAFTFEECQYWFEILMDLLLRLGFQISLGKVVHLCQQLTFPGIQIETVVLELSLLHEKLTETELLVSEFLGRRRATKRQLHQLAGKLNWASRVMYGGRTFLRHIIYLINSLVPSNAKALLTQEFFLDLYW